MSGGRDTLVPVPVAVAVTVPEDRPTTVAVAEDLVDAEPDPEPLPWVRDGGRCVVTADRSVDTLVAGARVEVADGGSAARFAAIVGITHESGSRAVGRVDADAGRVVPAAGRFEPVPFGAAEKRVDAAAKAAIRARAVAENVFAGAYDRPSLLEGSALRAPDDEEEGMRLRGGRSSLRGAEEGVV
jgi:hypothetical protein